MNAQENLKNIKDNVKDMKKPKIEVPPMPKARINPGLLGLAALGVAGAFYYFNYMQKPVAVV